MLNTNISKIITGTSIINDVPVASMHASFSTNGDITINKNVMNQELYEQNKAAVRKDMLDFEQQAYDEQDGGSINE